jgi:NADPH:quinone reductase-like Zn-dependent oxidoreductase
MKAIVYTEFGPPEVLHLEEAEKPAPKANEVLVKVHAAPVNYGDLLARKGISSSNFNMPLPLLLPTRMQFGFGKPKINILGSEFAGQVEAIGKDVTRFKAGDQVMGYLGPRMGAYAQYVCMPDNGSIARKPANMTYAEASAVPYGALMATSLLRKGNLQPGQKVLINGASGGIGSAAVQIARYYGAEVTGVCGTPRLDYVKALGAHHVVDYTKEDFTRSGATYDLIFDILGKRSLAECKDALAPNGIFLMASFKMQPLFQMLWMSMTRRLSGHKTGKQVICTLASEQSEDLVFITELVEAGKFKTILDCCYPMEEAAAAHRYVESGRKTGNVVITVCKER